MQDEQHSADRRRRAVVIEGDPALRILIDHALVLDGCEPPSHTNIDGVLRAALDADFVVLDVDALDSHQTIILDRPAVLLTSGFNLPPDCPSRHVVLLKPFRISELLDAVHEITKPSS